MPRPGSFPRPRSGRRRHWGPCLRQRLRGVGTREVGLLHDQGRELTPPARVSPTRSLPRPITAGFVISSPLPRHVGMTYRTHWVWCPSTPTSTTTPSVMRDTPDGGASLV